MSDGVLESAASNVVAAFFEFGKNCERPKQYADDGIIGLLSDTKHPIGNFAFVLRPNPHSAKRLHEIAVVRPYTALYLLPSDDQPAFLEIMEAAGFVAMRTLEIMVCKQLRGAKIRAPIELVEGFNPRFELLHFLGKQFFGDKASSDYVADFAAVSARTSRAHCWSVADGPRPIAGAMTYETEDAVGIYNLAVRNDRRRRGLGEGLVKSLTERVLASGRVAILQCSEEHQDWYQRIGYEPYGPVLTLQLDSN